MEQAEIYKKTFRLQLLAVVIGVVLLAAKFTAYLITHSNTILTDALESIINVVAGAFALYSLYLSSKPKDQDHPYGHGKVEFISAGLEGVLIAIAGVLIIGKSIFSFLQPRPLEQLDTGLYIIIASGIVNLILGFLLKHSGEKHRSLVLTADGEHLLSDAYSSFGIVGGIGIILFTHWYFLDNVVAIIFGVIIILTGYKLTRRSIRGIMDEADETIVTSIVNHLNKHRREPWIDIHNLRVIQYGNKLHVDCHVTIPWYFTLEEAHKEMEEVAAIINTEHGTQVEFFIHGDPCVPESCRICSMSNCPVRQHMQERKIEWTTENVQLNKKHTVLTK